MWRFNVIIPYQVLAVLAMLFVLGIVIGIQDAAIIAGIVAFFSFAR